MNLRTLTAVAGLLAWSALTAVAQDKSGEKLPPPPLPVEKPATPPAIELQSPDHCCPESDKQGIKILWLENDVPIQRLVPREVITEKKFTTMEVAYRVERRTITDVVMKPKEVVKEVPCTTVKPVEEIDPHTGKCCTVMKPCTEVKLVKETCFVAAVEQREVEVQVPYLKPVEIVVPSRSILFEYRTEFRKEGCAIPTCDMVPVERFFVAPKIPCAP